MRSTRREGVLSCQPHSKESGYNQFCSDVTEHDVPEHDVLLAGFPCQPFSIVRIIAHHRPKAFLLEDVKNLLSHDKGNTFRVIRETLANELGYNVQFRVLDAKPFVAQHRERIFLVGFRENTAFDFNSLQLPPKPTWPKLKSILHPEDGSEVEEQPYTIGAMAEVSPKYTLTDHLWNYLQRYAEKHRAAGNGFGFNKVAGEDTARTLSARYYKDGSEILISQGLKKNPRRLTPRECARLMGFDRVGEKYRIVVADTPAYKQFGNAVVVPVIEAISQPDDAL